MAHALTVNALGRRHRFFIGETARRERPGNRRSSRRCSCIKTRTVLMLDHARSTLVAAAPPQDRRDAGAGAACPRPDSLRCRETHQHACGCGLRVGDGLTARPGLQRPRWGREQRRPSLHRGGGRRAQARAGAGASAAVPAPREAARPRAWAACPCRRGAARRNRCPCRHDLRAGTTPERLSRCRARPPPPGKAAAAPGRQHLSGHAPPCASVVTAGA